MPSLRTLGLTFAWASVSLFDDLDLHLTPGFAGLVGANGAGKSTLLALLAGALRPDAGRIVCEPPDSRVVLCAQVDPPVVPDDVLAFAADSTAGRLRARLRLEPAALDRWGTCSPGERRRWRIGAALASEPDVLLLDEPTNHLDDEARRLLLGALRTFRGIGLVVSHDRALLDALTTSTVRLARGRVQTFEGPYSVARAAWLAAEDLARRERERAQQQRDVAKRRLADARRSRQEADRQRSASNRMRDRNDHDARGMLATTLASWAEAGAGRRVEVARRSLDRAEGAVAQHDVPDDLGRGLRLGHVPCPRPRFASFEGLLQVGGRALGQVSLHVERTGRLHLAGPNGSGKSTLLAQLAASAADAFVLPQVLTDPVADLERVRALPADRRGRVLELVAALGVNPGRLLASARPSPGEARKLRLAFGLGAPHTGLLLDEPTNDLDLPAIERLQDALVAWPGALVLVTHDDALAAACTTARLVLPEAFGA